ncbi:MAG: glycogen debranching protein GlgX [Gammaproteobacteria bacterium]|nr:glycogen debranching protein GlgX [Gammaproteobacteria bacterium]
MNEPREPALGPSPDDRGTGFAVYSSLAERVEVCLFATDGAETGRFDLERNDDGVWSGHVPGCKTGQRYGYRAHGPYDPGRGLRCNPAQLLIDPYARRLAGEFRWTEAVFDDNELDSAGAVPFSVVTPRGMSCDERRPLVPWGETIFYECNLRGYTMRHPALDDAQRGTFAGMRNREIIDYIRALGVTSVELMPVHAFIDEQHLVDLGLRNFWGYNSISFFAPMPRYASVDADVELRDMVRAFHDAGLEVILDVVYNHTGEGGADGPTLSFRGLDNLTYYRTPPLQPGTFVNDTGCGNTINVDHPRVRELIVESLAYFAGVIGIDGFRFDLATILGRRSDGFVKGHPLLLDISNDDRLASTKLVAEPWDPGPGGYQLGNFPPRWAEWNDVYRDTVREFWRGDHGKSGILARRLHGSADIFEASLRGPNSSVNLVTAHDGFTLRDAVSYVHRHNEANGEDNRDGHAHNYSVNYGVEGDSDDADVLQQRRRHRLNLLATLMFSQGTPLLLAGDEFGNSQQGNNNAYAQDNETGWLDWSGIEADPDFVDQVRELVHLRRENPLLRLQQYVHGTLQRGDDVVRIDWINQQGDAKQGSEWADSRAFTKVITQLRKDGRESAVAILLNAHHHEAHMRLSRSTLRKEWRIAFCSATEDIEFEDERTVLMPGQSIALLLAST